MSPCQGECRGFEPLLPLHLYECQVSSYRLNLVFRRYLGFYIGIFMGSDPGRNVMGDDSSKESETKESQDKGADPASDLAILPVVAGAEGEAQADANTGTEVAPATPAEPGFKRRSLWQSTAESLNYVNGIAQDEAIKVRDSDRATSIALLITSIITLGAMLWEPAAPHRMPLLLACDALIGASIILYLGNRFGILTTFTPRQALLAWQLMTGSTFLGIFITINLALILGVAVVTTTPIEGPNF